MKPIPLILLLILVIGCSKDEVEKGVCGDDQQEIASGPRIEFIKGDGNNPNFEENQDRITDQVWLTRDNNGGGLYNAFLENAEDKDGSPEGTLWALGTTEEVCDLAFAPFRTALGKPKDLIDKEVVLFLPEEGLFFDLTITSWSRSNVTGGGFAYSRSTL